MNGYTVKLFSTARQDVLEGVTSFVGEDDSGSFSLWAGHERMSTVLGIGLSRLRDGGGRWRYVAFPGAVLYFHDNVLTLSTRRYWIDEDVDRITGLLNEHLQKEEKDLVEGRESLRRMEEALLRRLYELEL